MEWLLVLLVAGAGRLMFASPETNAPTRTPEKDKQALIELENTWLTHLHDPTALEKLLAPDFLHPVPSGNFLTKTEHISYSGKHTAPAGKQRSDQLQVRVYGETGIVNGVVISMDASGQETDRSVFTDVFVFRNGQWQAVNAQENRVEQSRAR
jgi:hypothetical protein